MIIPEYSYYQKELKYNSPELKILYLVITK